MSGEVKTGKVKMFNAKKGYGFIHDNGKDYFFHFTNIVSDDAFKVLKTDDSVTYEVEEHDGKFRAINVKKIKE